MKILEISKNISKEELKEIGIDEIDFRILSHLSKQPRATYADLSLSVGLSRDAVKYRFNKLVLSGIIKGFNLELDLSKLGFSNKVMLNLRINKDNSNSVDELEKFLNNSPYVETVFRTAGVFDLVAIIFSKDNKQLLEVIDSVKARHGNIIMALEVVPLV